MVVAQCCHYCFRETEEEAAMGVACVHWEVGKIVVVQVVQACCRVPHSLEVAMVGLEVL